VLTRHGLKELCVRRWMTELLPTALSPKRRIFTRRIGGSRPRGVARSCRLLRPPGLLIDTDLSSFSRNAASISASSSRRSSSFVWCVASRSPCDVMSCYVTSCNNNRCDNRAIYSEIIIVKLQERINEYLFDTQDRAYYYP
jgi:hypothetical protein